MKDYLVFNDEDLAAFIKQHKGTIHTREFPSRCSTCRFIKRFQIAEKVRTLAAEYLEENCSINKNALVEANQEWECVVGDEFINYKCSTENCKRPVVAYEWGDHWCKKDLDRVAKLRGEGLR